MESKLIKVGITHGDINGIGYEVILKTLSDPTMLELCTPVIYGSSKIAGYHRKVMDMQPVNMSVINRVEDAGSGRVNIINCVNEEIKVELGRPSDIAGEAAFKALESAIKDLRSGLIDVLVTAPINKKNIQNEQFAFPGHTEYLEKVLGEGEQGLVILVKDSLRIALVTGNVPFAKIPDLLNVKNVLSRIKVFNQSLIKDFGIVRPRIAVLSLNPHAGEEGLIGKEEQEIIIPAMDEAAKERILCFGPFPSDAFFGSANFMKYDGVLAMYHDQGMTPFKTLAMESGVNFTAGLPVIRTSPIHGTAYDIAGKGIASENAFRNALYLSIDVFKNRNSYKEMTANPLKKQYFERGSDNEKLDLTSELE